jgi:UDP-galactopyranose mutase
MSPEYDYIIVGAGLFGSVFAYEAKQRGKNCLILEKRSHTGGNIHCTRMEDVNVHTYGAHIFHTNDEGIWNYVNRFASFNNYINSPIANYKGRLYNLPFNMNTFYQLWGVTKPEEARQIIREQIARSGIGEPHNLEDQAIKLVGTDIYEKLIKHYTEKQWGKKCTELPPFIIKRLPVRFTYNNNYYNDRFQGIPAGGYNQITDKLLSGIEVKANTNFFSDAAEWKRKANKIVYTGPLDAFYNYRFGYLEYRSLRFEHEVLQTANFQGNAVMNYTDPDTPYTRIIEHKHFEFGEQPLTVITREYPLAQGKNNELYYPVNDVFNMKIFKKYKELAAKETHVIFGGRLAEYHYYDMHQVIAASLALVRKEFA